MDSSGFFHASRTYAYIDFDMIFTKVQLNPSYIPERDGSRIPLYFNGSVYKMNDPQGIVLSRYGSVFLLLDYRDPIDPG